MTAAEGPTLDPSAQAEFDRLMLLAIHDLRAPIRQSLLRAQLLQRSAEGTLNPASTGHLAALMEANRSANRLLTRLAEFSQTRSTPGLLPPVPAAVLLRSAIQTLSADSDVSIEIGELPDHPVPASLQKVFFELLDNARKFRRPPPNKLEIRVTSDQDGSNTVFRVQDNGIGFDPRYAKVVWEPLQKLNGAEYPGCGLGLAMVRRIVEILNGKVWVISSPGEGSTFSFAIPAQ